MATLSSKILEDKLEREKDYWIQKLAGNLTVASLPADFRRSDSNGHEKGSVQIQIDAETAARLRRICADSEALIFAALVAALKVCLHKYTGHEDIIVGTTIHERYRETATFNKLLALRTRVSGEMTARQLLMAVKDTLAEAYKHQKYPFEKLLEHVNGNHERNGAPLFQVVITLDNINRRDHLQHLNNDLTLVFSLDNGELKGSIEYAAQLFRKQTIDLFGKHYHETLRALVNSPEMEIARFELLSGAEKQQLIFDYNRSERPYPTHKTIHQLFEEQVELTPQARAVTFAQQHLTYRELNQRANQLAHHLQRLGIEPGARVGIYMAHSLETLIAILGVLKAGAAYVPVDPDHPIARLSFMIEDAGISVLLTESSLVEKLAETNNARLFCLDSDWDQLASESTENPSPKATAEDLAYVIYTSGSTGTPKGVKIQHRALVNYIWWAKDTYLQGEKLDFPLYSSLAFDLTVTSIFTPLITGNRVVVYRPDRWQSPLTEILKDDQVGVLKLTPSHLALIKDADNSRCHIKRLIVGGEAFESELARQVYESFGRQVEIYNEYGPTEATVGCMIYRFDPAQVDLASVPIGRPAANVQIYILDEQLLPVAENVIGELYISGDGLAAGYLNRDDLTAESFISNPFLPGQRMYRTKDLARWLPDHEIDYVGRKDEQVKFHGYRVELNEIRSVLNRYPGIRDSVVLVRKKPGHGNDLMIAYYAARQEIEPRLLRDFMVQFIIKETIPNVFVHLKKLPLTLNGKVNLEALPDVEESRAQSKQPYLAPRTAVEAALLSIWEETLGFKQVGIEDNFFELGGHSLLATQLMSHVREVFQVELQLRSLFAEPTVKALAKKIEEQMKPERRLSEPPIVPVSRAQRLPLSFAQQRLWFFEQLEPGTSYYNVPVAIRLKGTLNVPVLEQTFNEIIRRHESLRTTFTTVDREPVQIISPPSPITLQPKDLSHLAENERESEARRLAQEEAQEPFDLEHGPLLRVKLLRLGETEHVVLLTMHHVVSDGWSWGPLLKEVTTLYDAYSRGESPTLPELPIQYADFAVWQRNWLQGEALEERLEYWRQHLAGAPPFLELPFSHSQPSDQVAPRGERIPINLDASLTEGLRALSRREGVTLFMTLLAAWQALLARYSNQDHIVVGTAIANRNRAETERLIGFFVNTLALHTDLSGDPSFSQLLERVKEVCLGAYSHQDVPFEKVVEELQPERSLSHTPLFQVMFVLQNTPIETRQLQGLTLNIMDGDSGTAQFILLLDLAETGNRITGALRYNIDLFEKSMIERIVGHFQSLLENVVSNADQHLSELSLLTADDRRQLLNECRGETISRPAVCLHELFERQVEETPNSVAVRFEGERLTYRELNERANQLAHHLRVLGVGPEVRVGICVERSLAMMVGLLGIFKAGGAYVPLDPAYPQERLAFMLEDAQVQILLTQERLLKLFGDSSMKSVFLDRDWETIAQSETENLRSGVASQNLAYVIYTSGSTGKPKGVMVQHQAIVNYTEAASRNFEIQPTDCVLQFASISFDAALEEIYPCLTRGATLILRTDDMLSSAATFLQKSQELGITVLDLPTAYWHQIASELARNNLTLPGSLRLVVIGGEEALPERVALWQQHTHHPVKLINTYGPTEGTVVATVSDLTTLVCNEVPIGRAVENVHAYVLDRHLELCPAGVVGELYLGGAGLARGYLNRPEQTAEKFIPNPFSTEQGDRLYRTGDLAWHRVDGQILFAGRADEQVKIRGFRVELKEIASVLKQHDAVEDAVIVAHEEESGTKGLVAYIVTDPSAAGNNGVQAGADLPDEQVNQWEQVFDDLYSDFEYGEAKFYIKGWTSSYTGERLPDEEVAEWMNQTVDRILALQPRRVLEIGCGGSGLVLFRVAPLCEQYLATDLSQKSLDVVSQQLRVLGQEIPGLVLQQRAAHDFEGIDDNSFDAVVITSVLQYFPGVEYLRTVLSQAVKAVRPGGFIFLGDVRSLPFLEAFHASVQLHRAPASLSTSELKTRILRQAFLEKQLTIDPNFFRAIKQQLPKITDVEIKLMRGNHHNELTKFRYDAIIHVGTTPTSNTAISWVDWERDQLTTDSVRQMLTENGPAVQGIRGVPNLRVAADLQIMKLIRDENGPKTIGELQRAIRRCEEDAIDPEYFWSLGEELSYDANIVYPDAGADGRYTVIFRRKSQGEVLSIASFDEEQVTAKPWHEYANNPTQHVFVSKLIPHLRQYMQQRLPDYMVPSVFMAIDSLPLLPNGKLDRRALPEPEHQRSTESAGYVAAQTAVEDMLVGIWSEVLGVEQVGVNDNFFDLGGHSLLATQIVSRVREIFGVEIALRKLFEAPTVSALAKNIENAISGADGEIAPPIERVSRDKALPLSFAQQRLWFIDQLEPGTSLHNVPAAVRLNGKLDVAALQQALDEVVGRHESLRTTFVYADGAPVQVISPPSRVSLSVIDLHTSPAAEREREVSRLAEEEAQKPFDLSEGPLLRTQLLRLGTEEHVLLLTMHHIVTDGWSMGIFVKEIVALYEAFVQGAPSPLSELTVQYADFAHWQHHWLQGAVLDQQLSYWRNQLSGAPALLELPTDRPRPPVQSFRGAHYSFTLSAELSEQLRQLSRREGVTLFMTLLAVFQTLLWRYSGERDVVVGADVANRNRHETEQLIGFFVNMLVLRTRIDGEESFSELLKQVREVCLGAYAHQDLPFEKLVEELEPERSLSHTPLFQVAFTFEKGLEQARKLPNLSLRAMSVGRDISQFDLTLGMVGDGDELAGTLGYNTDLFEAATIERMAQHLITLLGAVAANPEDKISELALLPKDEGSQLLVEFNQTARQFPLDICLTQLFEAQVSQTPNAVAVEFEGERLTYRQLNNRANRLARNLAELGVGPEILVALMARRSIDFVTAVLAIFKAGGAYVPLDPLHPARRLAQVLSRSQSSLVLAVDEFMSVISQALESVDTDPQLCSLDDLLEREASEENLPARSAPGNLAYVIYTSGSTGTPKGAMLEQRGMCNHLWSKVLSLQLTQNDVVAQTASQNFDVSVWQMLAVLIVGGQVFIAGEDLARDSIGQLKMVAEKGVTILEIVPSQLRTMVEEMGSTPSAERPDLSPLRWLIVNGEPLTPELCRQWFSIYPEIQLINAYGPTECSDDVTQYVIERSPAPATLRMSIGSPLPNMRMYVLDKKLSPVPLGVPGELYIGGIGVGRGYLREPARTAEIYIPDCFGKQPGARLYKTGDRVRWLPDGNLDFLERIDYQVKVRGYRIELGEIEAALGQHDDIKECVVIVREDVPGQRKLVAYFVAEQSTPSGNELVLHLKERLPEYMIPSAFVQLTELPLTSNGKTDRRALPEPTRGELDQNYVPSRTSVEELLVGMWREVVHVDQVGIDDNFFELGGHSLLATQLISRVRKAFGVEVPLRQLFESPTVAELAQHIEQSLAKGSNLQDVPIVPVSRDVDLPLSFGQERLWFIDQLDPGTVFYNVPAAVRLTGKLDREAFQQTLTEIVRRHEMLRTSFSNREGRGVQAIHPAAPLEMPLTDLSRLPEAEREAEVQRLAQVEAEQTFDLSQGRLFVVKLLRLSEEEHVVLLTMHHIISDGWSIGLLIKEVGTLYKAFMEGTPSPLEELQIQYADYAYWQRSWLAGETLEKQLAYWKKQLTGAPAMLELPTDRARPAVRRYRGATRSFVIRAETVKALKELSRREDVTLFMTLLAAWKVLLARYSGQVDIPIGTPIAGRNRRETEDLIGFFVNTLVLRTDLSGNPAFRELLRRVRDVCLSAYAHQDLPFEKLVEELQPERTRSHSPLFQVLFSLQNAPVGELTLPGLSLSVLDSEQVTAKFDLSLVLAEEAGELRGVLEYDSDLFEAGTIESVTRHFENLLEAIISTPEQQVLSLPYLSEFEREQLISKSLTSFEPQDLIQLFEAQVQRTPRATALVHEDQRVTYEELNSRANQLAHHLRSLGVGVEVLVAVCMTPSIDMVVAILGIVKAGAAYVPLDPGNPQDRLSYMLDDAQVAVLITQEPLLESLPSHWGHTICLDSDWESIETSSSANPPTLTAPDNLAYVIYTSGSTGMPKGVQLHHAGLSNLVAWHHDVYQISEVDHATLLANVAFDASVWELWPYLTRGATLHIVPEEIRSDAGRLMDWLNRSKITIGFLPTPLAEAAMWLETRADTSLRVVLTGGDKLHRGVDEGLGFRLVNHYGPTEGTVVATAADVEEQKDESQFPHIGKPISNTEVYILDQQQMPLPRGIPGEICIGGVGLARGYWQRPDLTAEKFIPNPFSSVAGSRLYRTGDRARFLEDGNIEFLGRLDEQVKIRGFRIELGEIEEILAQHPSIREAVVLAREDEPGNKRLVAYCVPDGELEQLSPDSLRDYLGTKLPNYMVPASYVILESFPLTANGKIDRSALPEPERIGSAAGDAYIAPRDILELRLTEIWQDVLGLESVGVSDDFFKLGGHSILAVRLMAKIQQLIGIDLPLTALFQSPTVENLASWLRREQPATTFSSLVKIQSGRSTPFFCVHPSGGNVLCYASLAHHLGPQQTFYGLQSWGLGSVNFPHTTIEEMATHYLNEMKTVQPHGPYFLGGWSMGGIVAFEIAQQLRMQGEQVGLLALLDSRAPAPAPDISELGELALMETFAQDMGLELESLKFSSTELQGLQPDEQLSYLFERARESNILPPDLDLDQLQRLFQLFKINVGAMLSYVPQSKHDRIVLLRTDEQPAAAGWESFATEGVDVHLVPGNHFSMIREPQVKTLADQLRTILDTALAESLRVTLRSSATSALR